MKQTSLFQDRIFPTLNDANRSLHKESSRFNFIPGNTMQSEGDKPQIFMERYLSPHAFNACRFAVNSAFFGFTSGPVIGGSTAVMSNLINTPQAMGHVMESTKLFGTLGLVYGLTGAGLMAATGEDLGYKERMTAGCLAGISAGLTKKSVGLACGGCLGLAFMSAAWEFFIQNPPLKEDPAFTAALKPHLPDDNQWKQFNAKYYGEK